MMKTESMRTLAAILAPEDEESQSAAAPGALPGLEERVELFLRALHGSREVTALERADARRRILDAMAADLAGEPDSYVVQSVKSASATSSAAAIAPARAARAAGPSALSRAWDVLREALLWPLMISSGGHPMRLVGVACALLLVAGGGWTGTWFYAAHRTETAIASLVASEAKAGRDYSCGSRSVGGFPLHVEVTCTALQATVAMSEQSTVIINAKSLTTVASIFHPNAYVTEISGPVSVTDSNQSATLMGNWSLAQMTLHSKAASPSKVALVLENPEFYRLAQGKDKPLLAGGRLELNADASAGSNIKIAAHAINMSIPEGGPITSRPFVANIAAVFRKTEGQGAQSFAERLRDWQSRGGHIDVADARLQQGDALASGTGQIGLNLNGRLEGSLNLNTTGPYQQLALSYIRDGQSGARKRERLAQSFLGQPRVQTRSLGATPEDRSPAARQRPLLVPAPGANLEIPIRFVDGTVYLGSTGLGALPPLF